MVRTRFAPSPNGSLHLGHAWSAIVAHDLARGARGVFLIRIEDIDGNRSRPELIDQMIDDLAWLGLVPDGEVVRQSARIARYHAAAETLQAMGLLYPCICTRSQIAMAMPQESARGSDGPIYPGTCRGRDVDPAAAAGGVAWRLDMARAVAMSGPLIWDDALAGRQIATPDIFGDIVLLRKDAPASYHLAATVDDAAQGITLVTRGADLFAATHVHRLLQALLGLPVPRWHHHPLLAGPDGRKLAKRRGAPALADLRLTGADGSALAAALRAGRLPAGISWEST